MRVLLLFIAFSSGICAAQAPAVCPWFSTGSAETILGGTVSLALHVESNFAGNCRFTTTGAGEQAAIEITIGKTDVHACPSSSTRLAALGNEAVQCKIATKEQMADLITGRVRDTYFVVSIIDLPDAAARPRDPFTASALERVAEQVVGNLY